MKKIMMASVTAVAVMFITGTVFAWGGCGFRAGDGKECYRAKDMKAQMKKELGLTADQEKKLDAGKEAHRKEMKALHDAMDARKDELKKAIAKPGATRAMVEPIVNELKVLEARKVEKRVDGIFEVKAVLTPEQFAKLEAMEEKRMKEWKGSRKGPRDL